MLPLILNMFVHELILHYAFHHLIIAANGHLNGLGNLGDAIRCPHLFDLIRADLL